MKKLKPYLRGLILIATLVAVGYLLQSTGLRGLFDESWVDSQIRGQGITGELLYFAMGAALTAIGLSGQASIDKVAGPVGEALIMTAIGLAVAVPAVLGYNWLLRRNKQGLDVLRSFGAALHVASLSSIPATPK